MKKSKLIGWPIVLIISMIMIVIGMWFGFTQGGLTKIGYDMAKGVPYYITTPFQDGSTAYSGILKLGIYFLTDGFLSLFVFDSSLSIVSIACYCIIVLSIILIVVQVVAYIRNKKPSMILWIIVPIIFAYGGSVICAMAQGYFGVNGEFLKLPAEIGELNPITLKNVLFFDKGFSTAVGNTWTAIGMTVFAWLVLVGVLLFVISVLVILIQTLVYSHTHRLDKYFKTHPELAEGKVGASVGFKDGAVGVGGTMNNINTVGNSSPLVVQYINSYGQESMVPPAAPQANTQKQEAPTNPQQPLPPQGCPHYGYQIGRAHV